jgi:hypothetical protein
MHWAVENGHDAIVALLKDHFKSNVHAEKQRKVHKQKEGEKKRTSARDQIIHDRV